MIGVIVGLLFLFFSSLNWLTNHGKETTVPKIVGKNMKDAVKILEKQGFKIQIDSTFISYKKPLEVMFQEPEIGSVVKIGRTVFLTVNRQTPPSIKMPNLVGMSFRNAMLVMQSYRLVMGDTLYRPDVAAGAILEQLYKGHGIAPGEAVPYGSTISLVVGEGLFGEVEVPNLIGLRWSEAKALIEGLQLASNIVWDGMIQDSANAVVYMQEPESLNELDFVNKIPKGDLIDLHIIQSPSPELISKNQPGSKKLLQEYNDRDSELNNQSVNPKNSFDTSSLKKKTTTKDEVIGTKKLPTSENNMKKKDPNNPSSPIKNTENKIGNEFD